MADWAIINMSLIGVCVFLRWCSRQQKRFHFERWTIIYRTIKHFSPFTFSLALFYFYFRFLCFESFFPFFIALLGNKKINIKSSDCTVHLIYIFSLINILFSVSRNAINKNSIHLIRNWSILRCLWRELSVKTQVPNKCNAKLLHCSIICLREFCVIQWWFSPFF